MERQNAKIVQATIKVDLLQNGKVVDTKEVSSGNKLEICICRSSKHMMQKE